MNHDSQFTIVGNGPSTSPFAVSPPRLASDEIYGYGNLALWPSSLLLPSARIRQTIFRPPSQRICVDDAKRAQLTFVSDRVTQLDWLVLGNSKRFQTTCGLCSASLTCMMIYAKEHARARYVSQSRLESRATYARMEMRPRDQRHRQKMVSAPARK